MNHDDAPKQSEPRILQGPLSFSSFELTKSYEAAIPHDEWNIRLSRWQLLCAEPVSNSTEFSDLPEEMCKASKEDLSLPFKN